MSNMILFLFNITLLLLVLVLMYKLLKKSSDFIEKIVYIVLAIIYVSILIIYYLDRFNIPTQLGLHTNVNTQLWLEIICNYITVMLSAGITIAVSIGITRYQIKKNNEDNDKRDKENLRIQNMPMLKYEIKTNGFEEKIEIDTEHLIISNCNGKNTSTYELFILIKNIGLNNVKRIIIDLESTILNKTNKIIDYNIIIPIEKNETKSIYRYFSLERDKEYPMKLIVYYQDVLQNWYCQTIDIRYEATKYNKNSSAIGKISYTVNEEILINKEKVPKE